MPKKQKFIKQSSRFYRSVVATALLTNGVFQFVAPVLAEGTAAGQSISNTATATYEDPNNPGVTIDSTSNTVTVTVAEVTGIAATAGAISDSTNGTVQVGDVLTYNFSVTNIGNDPTQIRIPSAVTLTESVSGAGTVGTVQYSIDGGVTWINVTNPNALTSTIPVYNPATNIGSTSVKTGTVLVRVPVTVNAAATPGTTIKVTLGNTPSTPSDQNQPLSISTANQELYTEDLADSDPTDVNGSPVGGEKEASANSTATVGSKDYALAILKKTQTAYNNNSTQSIITDDTITYGLSLKVDNNTITGTNITPSALKGSAITLNTGSETRILVSDAIPAGTELDLSTAPTPPNANWEPVYTTSAVGTIDANAATWKRFNSGALQSGDTVANVTRVGFINKDAITSLPADGTDITGFSIKVKVKSTATAPLTIANIAQVFGSTVGNDQPVYDESGDNNPSNYDPGTSSFPGTDSNGDGVPDTIPAGSVEDGYIDTPTNPETGSETTNNGNDGTGPLGEANVFTINTSSLLNGPNGQPGALGPTNDNNTDFTNKSSTVPANTAPGTKIDPSAVTFTNTFINGGSNAGTVTLVPTPPATAGDLPASTTVTITYAAQTATYTYDGTSFSLTNGTAISIPNVAANTPTNYNVSVDLPANTALSTDTGKGYPVPITATIGGTTSNITIDRVYTGFLKLVKLSRILDASGNVLTGARAAQSDFETTPVVGTGTATPRTPLPGEIIEYLIRYKNIAAEDNTNGANNVLLNVNNLVITEDGTLGANSNWALDQDSNSIIDTSHVMGSAVDSGTGATITYTPSEQSGTTQATDVTKYVNTIGVQIAPGVQRTFTFKRKVN
ncbi:hypothetical protein NIES2100_25610 [Calothrix sp. NIES-2100]|uniref:beta strand repeat-containing protein n=1 Tax=Calothrix sp. NIES-2100 TaxID=1954172 RepID=UPI000B61C28C|nr:hypothetical protein NIES2100_25610 [Calothrix sp. NIES-2100]